MYSQPGFGRRLRRLRRDKDLSQAELAGEGMSASYISMLENGRRVPTTHVVGQLAARLGLQPEQLTGQANASQPDGQRPFSIAQRLDHQTARQNGELDVAVSLLRELWIRARADGQDQIAWGAQWDLSEVLEELDQSSEQLEVLETLADDPITRSSARLEARVHTAIAGALRRLGKVRDSIEQAQRAVSISRTLDANASERTEALIDLVASLTESGQLDLATEAATQVLELVEHLPSQQLKGFAYWAVGNVWFRVGRITEAVAAHDQAFALLRPDINLRRWARLSKASAAMRLEADQDPQVARMLLSQARAAFDLVGNDTDRLELLAVETSLRLADGDARGAMDLGRQVIAQGAGLAPQDLGTCLVAVARAGAQLGECAESATAYRRAATLFEAAGAFQRAATLWRTLSYQLEAAHGAAGRLGGDPLDAGTAPKLSAPVDQP